MNRSLLLVGVVLLAGCNPIGPSPASPDLAPVVVGATSLQLAVSPAVLPVNGGSAEVTIRAITTGDVGVADVLVKLVAHAGAVEPAETRTDAAGEARVRWTATRTGTLVATSGVLTSSLEITVEPAPIPKSSPPPPAPKPPPLPPAPKPPTQPFPTASLTVQGSPAQVNTPVTFTAAVAGLGAGERVVAYQWYPNGIPTTGTPTPKATTIIPTWTFKYDGSGVKTPAVIILTTTRQIQASAQVIVYDPLSGN